jgi:uncharacterized protein (UPF0335 family)
MNPIMQEELKDLIRRIENVKKEQDELAIGLKDIYKDAASSGFDVKVIREVIKRRRSDQKERNIEEEMIEMYIKVIGS